MLREQMEDLRRLQDAFNQGQDAKALWLTLVDPQAENLPPTDWPEGAPLRGAEAIWEFYIEAFKAWDNPALTWADFIETPPNKLVANQRAELRGKTSGAGVIWSYWAVFTFRHGRVVRIEWFDDRAEALEAARVGS